MALTQNCGLTRRVTYRLRQAKPAVAGQEHVDVMRHFAEAMSGRPFFDHDSLGFLAIKTSAVTFLASRRRMASAGMGWDRG